MSSSDGPREPEAQPAMPYRPQADGWADDAAATRAPVPPGEAAPTVPPDEAAPTIAPGDAAPTIAPAGDASTITAAGDAATITPAGGAASGRALCARGQFGPYELVQELGRGGMGVVYKAWHRQLQVFAAVKVLLEGELSSPAVLERFQKEAQATARLRHPGIVAVHDVGVAEGKAYFAMEYVEGVALDRVLEDPARAGLVAPPGAGGPGGTRRGLAPRDAAGIAREVAEAMDHAHRQGVIHRDLKPGNILIDRAGHARVVDFGLAKLVGGSTDATRAPSLTRTGSVMGTLAYMPPEQAQGAVHDIDARTDVYALGATLYELVTGSPPFASGSYAEVLYRIISIEPPRPRRIVPDLPVDLEAIVGKAMEKERERRYASGAELAADLGRFLAGQEVRARPPSTGRRARVWVRRRWVPLAASAALLVVAAGAVFFAARARQAGTAQAALRAKVLDEVRTKARRYVEAALLLRRSGVGMAKARAEYLPPLRRAVEEAAALESGRAESHYHLGRLYRALLQSGAALAEQDAALAAAPHFAPSRYERAVLTANALAHRLAVLRERAVQTGAAAVPGASVSQLWAEMPAAETLARGDREAEDLRGRLVADLDELVRGAAAAGSGERLAPARVACARALALAYGSWTLADHTEAGTLLEQALRDDPTLEEACEGLAFLALARGDLARAVAVYDRGLEVDRGYVPFWIARAEARIYGATRALRRGERLDDLCTAALADCDRALELEPDSVAAWETRGMAVVDWGLALTGRGEDPTALYTRSVADFTRALALDPRRADLFAQRGKVQANLGWFRTGQGQDPAEPFAAAEADYGRALELDPTYARAWEGRGLVRTDLGFHRMNHGADPAACFEGAIRDLERATALEPGRADVWMNRGMARMDWARDRSQHGDDPTELYRLAADDHGRAAELAPERADVWMWLGLTQLNWGVCDLQRGRDAQARLRRAIEALSKAVERNPAFAEAWMRLGLALVNLAGTEVAAGRDPEPLFVKAMAAYDKAVRANPRLAQAYVFRAMLRQTWGPLRMERGEAPAVLVKEVLDETARALELDPRHAQAWAVRGGVLSLWVDFAGREGKDVTREARDARASFDRALALDPRDADSYARRGHLHGVLGEWPAAVADFEAAGRINPGAQSKLADELAEARRRAQGGAAAPAAPPWLAVLARGEQAVTAGDYTAAGEAFGAGLAAWRAVAEADRARLLEDAKLRRALVGAEYDFACVLALRSAGKAGPDAAPQPIAPAEAVRLRDEAFEHLHAAVRLGWSDAAHLRADTDLAPLHDDPRWAELVRDLPAAPK